ncbi:DUF3768 domain-containing protein [Sphingomonas elodea]|uniref:DUF3768 domain-containing protein n=1 Tax=Sphingomonas elodea TaxID=179878 RepID=UPI00026301A7|nr:DUF3768 domain-containing protein [Sphingomonas elodea]
MTAGILAVVDADPSTSVAKQAELMGLVSGYDAFTEDNNPDGERSFGDFDWQGVRCDWKIDYYDWEMDCISDNPADPAATCRVLTILRVDEY